jgi:hypothetical protein
MAIEHTTAGAASALRQLQPCAAVDSHPVTCAAGPRRPPGHLLAQSLPKPHQSRSSRDPRRQGACPLPQRSDAPGAGQLPASCRSAGRHHVWAHQRLGIGPLSRELAGASSKAMAKQCVQLAVSELYPGSSLLWNVTQRQPNAHVKLKLRGAELAKPAASLCIAMGMGSPCQHTSSSSVTAAATFPWLLHEQQGLFWRPACPPHALGKRVPLVQIKRAACRDEVARWPSCPCR